jgi:hypothetical protein
MPLSELYLACQGRAGTLMGRDTGRTTTERVNLATDTAQLLLAVSARLATGERPPGTPSQTVLQGSEDFLPAFLTTHEIEMRQLRYRTLVAASDLACGGNAEAWRQDGKLDGERAYDLAMGSEEGLALVLAHLEEIFMSRNGPKRK